MAAEVDARNALTKKLGPLPGWAWVLGGAGVAALAAYLWSRSGSQSAQAPSVDWSQFYPSPATSSSAPVDTGALTTPAAPPPAAPDWATTLASQLQDLPSLFAGITGALQAATQAVQGQAGQQQQQPSQPTAAQLLAQAEQKSRQWFGASPAEQQQLHQEAQQLYQQAAAMMGGQAVYNPGTGITEIVGPNGAVLATNAGSPAPSPASSTAFSSLLAQAHQLGQEWFGASPAQKQQLHAQAQQLYQQAAAAIGGKAVYNPATGVTHIYDAQGRLVA